MEKNEDKIAPVIFLGTADILDTGTPPYPVSPIDIYRLSYARSSHVYPVNVNGFHWLFLINKIKTHAKQVKIFVDSVKNHNLLYAYLSAERVKVTGSDSDIKIPKAAKDSFASGEKDEMWVPDLDLYDWVLLQFEVNGAIKEPEECVVVLEIDGEKWEIGSYLFSYVPAQPFSPEQINAMKADPTQASLVKYILGCKECPSKLEIYSGFDRDKKLEDDGCIWQYDVPEEFVCECGKTKTKLKYIREGLHTYLGSFRNKPITNIEYVRQYAHSKIVTICDKFNKIIDNEKDEKPVQDYIETNPIMLAKYHPIKLYPRKRLLGKFEADFIILDSNGRLLFIEIEKPSMKLFKKDGHPTQYLVHAHEQVKDWIYEYRKHKDAVLEDLDLRADSVLSVQGVVIAGISKNADRKHVQRLLSKPLYDCDFLTLDDLSTSLLQLSKDLA